MPRLALTLRRLVTVPDAVLLLVLLGVVQNSALLFPVELLLLEVDFEDTFDDDEGESSDQHPLEVVPDGVEENSAHDRGYGRKQQRAAQDTGGRQGVRCDYRSRWKGICGCCWRSATGATAG